MTNLDGFLKQGIPLKTGNYWKEIYGGKSYRLLAIPTENTRYGQMYKIKGNLTGPNGKILAVCTIWMTETTTGDTKFITMYPKKGEGK